MPRFTHPNQFHSEPTPVPISTWWMDSANLFFFKLTKIDCFMTKYNYLFSTVFAIDSQYTP